MNLSNLIKLKGKTNSKKRLGRGIGSGKGGHTAGRGTKGQKARRGNGKPRAGFEGGQVPLYKRLPRINSFRGLNRAKPLTMTLERLNAFDEGTVVTLAELIRKGFVKALPKGGIKVVATGDLKKKLTLKGFKFSATAIKKIEKSGSKIVQ
jgi:large subunit ribosomal protein L15